jgi:hypothetical protein
MRRPRPVALTGAKRRALRVIEETLTEEDPGLSVAARVVGGGRPAGTLRAQDDLDLRCDVGGGARLRATRG